MPKKPTAKNDNQPPKPVEGEIPSAPPVFDVSKPGKTAAEPTSRPIIVTHKPMIKQDPMVAPAEESSEKPLSSKKEASISPISNSESEADDKPKSQDESSDEPKKEAATDNISGSGAIDALADEAESKKKDKKTDEEAAQKAAEIQNLIQSREYNLPIHDSGYRGRGIFNTFITVLLILLLLGTLFVLAVDAELIKVNLELPFDLIK